VGGKVVPVLYGGQTDEAAASETIFHTVSSAIGEGRPKRVFLEKYRSWQWSEVVTARDLALVRLDDEGLSSLGLVRDDLIAGGRDTYPETRAWAEALAGACPGSDGLWWMSRQAPDHWAIMLFGRLSSRTGGIGAEDLRADSPAVPFGSVEGLSRLDQLAEGLGITVIRS
jgi:hypothetical protein